jgi:hypothetical protein
MGSLLADYGALAIGAACEVVNVAMAPQYGSQAESYSIYRVRPAGGEWTSGEWSCG